MGRRDTRHQHRSEQETTYFDNCLAEYKAKGGGKGDWKANLDKVVSENIPEKVTSQKSHTRQEKKNYQNIWESGPRLGKSVCKGP